MSFKLLGPCASAAGVSPNNIHVNSHVVGSTVMFQRPCFAFSAPTLFVYDRGLFRVIQEPIMLNCRAKTYIISIKSLREPLRLTHGSLFWFY